MLLQMQLTFAFRADNENRGNRLKSLVDASRYEIRCRLKEQMMKDATHQYPPLPPDDPKRALTVSQPSVDQTLLHIGVVGDTYTLLVSGAQTAGRFCLFDMHIPPGGGPGPHLHDFEETFIVLDGEVEVTFRGNKSTVKAGETVNVPSNAPHQFHNSSSAPARLLCLCSPAGQENFFMEVGVKVDGRTTPPPKLDEAEQKAFAKKAGEIALQYRTEILDHA